VNLEVRMRETITVTLSIGLRVELEEFATRHGVASSDVISSALREYLYFHRSRRLRTRMMAEAQAQGLWKDEDVFGQIS
jgi:metal-responsive CopG/Arc/MetJ family transcriptional regulator